MRDPIWFKDFEREYNEREDRIAEIKERSLIKKEWVGLTDEEREEIALELPIDAVRITEAKLKEKNGMD